METVKKVLRAPTALVVVIAAILGLIGVAIKSVTDTRIAKIPIEATQTAEIRLTELALSTIAQPSITLQPTLSPSQTPTISSNNTSPTTLDNQALNIPEGYVVFDSFDETESFNSKKWLSVGKFDKCISEQKNGVLSIKCQTTEGDVNLGFLPSDESLRKVQGVALAAEMLTDDYNGSSNINITFEGEDGELRVYFLQLRFAEFKISEIYPHDNWRGEDLAQISVSSGMPHTIRAEYQLGVFNVWIDDNQLQLQTNLPTNATWIDWKLEPYLALVGSSESKRLLETNIFWVSTLQ